MWDLWKGYAIRFLSYPQSSLASQGKVTSCFLLISPYHTLIASFFREFNEKGLNNRQSCSLYFPSE
uniref:Uncharacterized protein n=1 Tax=Candidatus Kentrum sp. FW TaxID=2126338 RepID=A0A450STP0_9GAMM|nr:MAG: hypothetical protein BECKFW1821A_GA0114235_10711 [Candidatus Kentron sp. FW]VFJ59053.1 MAG: hypothetical protein BECKFW1821A_GA0114235_10881 [Candidatus Kentron sp. FW]VFJ61936.1 MAG: hypothetical protein BECKFW1821A_GA0114235_11201 [Candidatus Kentron sp. FW]VFJ61964.1 MAG: hypothetical protein BECKFW1821A_GA0114235_112011 [Candidatus Kentron sp. FW]VFJ65552.1 MAG: hypothetical protein BECKFW1821A_GA0114235_12081 [Candidatus Kentron sp. FW]